MIDPERLRELVALHDAASGDAVLKESERGRVTRVPFDEQSDAVCKEDAPTALRSQVGNLLKGTRASRSLSAAEALRAARFRVAEPLGLFEEGGRSVYVARHVEGPTLQAALDVASRDEGRALARAAARFAARVHGRGFAFRDLKPPNLIVAATEPKIVLVPIDLDDVTRPRKLPRRSAWRNLAALDAYGQACARPLGVRTRWEALRAYCLDRGLELASLWTTILERSREKRKGWSGGP